LSSSAQALLGGVVGSSLGVRPSSAMFNDEEDDDSSSSSSSNANWPMSHGPDFDIAEYGPPPSRPRVSLMSVLQLQVDMVMPLRPLPPFLEPEDWRTEARFGPRMLPYTRMGLSVANRCTRPCEQGFYGVCQHNRMIVCAHQHNHREIATGLIDQTRTMLQLCMDDPEFEERIPELVSRIDWLAARFLRCACARAVGQFWRDERLRRDLRNDWIQDYVQQRVLLHNGNRHPCAVYELLHMVFIWQFGGPHWDSAHTYGATNTWGSEGPCAPGAGSRVKASRPKKAEHDDTDYTYLDHVFSDDTGEKPVVEKRQVRDNKKGRYAWQAVRAAANATAASADRLLVHSVGDTTALTLYLPRVRGFFEWLAETNMPCATWPDLDQSLQLYLAVSCYVRDQHPCHGSFVVNGLCYLYPEATRLLPRSWRAMQSWGKLTITDQGGPEGLESFACMEDFLRQAGTAAATCAADMLPVAIDAYLREQDMTTMMVEDVIWAADKRSCAVLLGRSRRGDSSKAGRDQGVTIDDPWCISILLRRCEGKPPHTRVFPISAATYAQLYKKAAAAVFGKSEAIGPPHSARHTGASRDLAEGYRTFEQVQRRGRWKAADSVQRYAKVHAWFECQARQPVQVREKGARILAQRPPRPPRVHE